MAFKVNQSSPIHWNYYLNDMWNDLTDNRVSELPIVSRGPWLIVTFMVTFLLTSIRVSNSMESKKSGYFMKPFQIIYYGFFFGIHGVAFPVVLALAQSLVNTVRCNFNDYFDSDLRGTMFIYASFLYLLIKLINTFDILILLWTKAVNQITFGLMMETIFNPVVIYSAIKYYPGGIVYFPIAFDCLINSIKYGLLTRACASASIKPIQNWEQLIHYLKIVQYLIITIHSIYSLTIPNCDCPLGLRVFFASIHFILAISYSFDGGYFFYATKSSQSTKSSPSSPKSRQTKDD
ncbi:uncharacterized protein LOC128392181 [Panonychus citri]|uniref:uncharacterized protein LOC128392181 n=1 Tax=Panonychus citri TaxID=50023 RepID=UPI002307E5E5|nr:uncharacterized protein LOC128392181 [Panonychus citri]XP_053208138.1 uncharacterized protein LOC128392181 [Panonychus citri]XP_053208139.1 uncharacterized protein LOC128392181 [Panonychus citri]XP_053208140.1 uncharacterized protein LOC128392181 [Panonychus citri]